MNRGTRFVWTLLPLAAVTMLLPGGGSNRAMAAPVSATLNGLQIVLDDDSGVLLRLSHPGAGTILDTTPEAAGLVDLSQPGEKPDSPATVAARRSEGRQDHEDRRRDHDPLGPVRRPVGRRRRRGDGHVQGGAGWPLGQHELLD